jgi:hypothetical protein
MNFFKQIQAIVGTIPVIWAVSYLCFVLFQHNPFIWKVAFFLFFAAFYAICAWCAMTLVISFIKKKFIFEWRNMIVFVFGSVFLIVVVAFDPGGYLYLILD